MTPSMKQKTLEKQYHIQQMLDRILPSVDPQSVVESCSSGANLKHGKKAGPKLNMDQYHYLAKHGFIDKGEEIKVFVQSKNVTFQRHKFTDKGLSRIWGNK